MGYSDRWEMEKGYPMGYRHIPLFLQCMFGTGAFEDLFCLFIRDPPHTGFLKTHEKKTHVLDFA